VLFVSFLVRLVLFPQKGYPIDTGDFASWFNTATENGIRPFYNLAGFADYPPFNVYIFWFFGSLAKAVSINIQTMIKLVPNLFDLATAALIYFFVRKQSSFKFALVATMLYAFNPAVIFNAAVWGQFDAVYTFFLVLSLIFALKSKPELSALTFALGLLTKPQGIALLPLIIFLIYKKGGLKKLLISAAVFTSTVFLVILPFEWTNPVTFLTKIYFGAYGQYSYTSINAFNLWGLYGLWVSDVKTTFFGLVNLDVLGWILFGTFAAFTMYFLNKRFKASNEFLAIFAAFLLFFAFFMLPTRIHERYLFPAISVLALMFPLIKRARPLYMVLTATLLINEAYVLYWLNKSYPNAAPNLTGDPIVVVVSVINLLMLVYASIIMWDKHTWLKSEPVTSSQTVDGGEPDEPKP
jgi:Gpi18-like mannosyltransferase